MPLEDVSSDDSVLLAHTIFINKWDSLDTQEPCSMQMRRWTRRDKSITTAGGVRIKGSVRYCEAWSKIGSVKAETIG